MNEKLEIGKYNPDATKENSYHYVDEYNLFLTHSDGKGIGDCIGASMEAYFIYNDPKLIEGISNLWQFRPEYNNKMVGIRHPDSDPEHIMSRDHYNYTLIAMKLWEKRNGFPLVKMYEIIGATPFGIKRMMRWTLPLIFWSKALLGNKVTLWLYLVQNLITANLIYIPIWKLGMWLAGWGEEVEQEDWVKVQLQDLPKWKSWIDKIILPSYAILFAAFRLYVTPDTFPKLKRAQQKSLLKMVGKTNYVQQMLLGEKGIPRERVEAFKSMKGGRWSGYLHQRNDRNMEIHNKNYTENVVDVDLVRYLYNETQL